MFLENIEFTLLLFLRILKLKVNAMGEGKYKLSVSLVP